LHWSKIHRIRKNIVEKLTISINEPNNFYFCNQKVMEKIICGIQQMGIGVPNVEEIWKWYRTNFGIDVRIFEEAAPAPLMTKYTGGIVQNRTATLALSMEGGGGFEIWQYTSRNTEKSSFEIQLGDYGMFACKIKSRNIKKSFEFIKNNGGNILNEPMRDPSGKWSFFVKDPNDNLFQIVEGSEWFSSTNHPSNCGGVAGTIIGVSDIEKSLKLYQEILGYETIDYDKTGAFNDLDFLNGGKNEFRRVRLSHKQSRKGPFAKLLGSTQIELVQAINQSGRRKIFENRFWGDWGFIHLCFDIQGMDLLKTECEIGGFPFTIDSSDTFDMGEAGGRFSYIEDPDGTWIEFVETHKVPIIKKIGWYLNLKNQKPGKFLPNWMLKLMAINRVK
jgi:catechol 2,3-dioxygenase-like lactoylglutathione lyase family enzyme